jgi:carbonic anhydrase/acetyltransferase-like protein (isoleucine patch superfamily)
MELPERIKKLSTEYKYIDKEKLKLSKLLKSLGGNQIKVKEKDLMEDNVILRGDLALISCDKSIILCENVIIHPSLNNANAPYEYRPTSIGKFTYIGKNSIISSLKIGEYVYIGENCILGDRTKVENNVKILDNTYVPRDMELVEYGIYEGYPAKLIGYLDNQNSNYMEFFCNEYYDKLVYIIKKK